MKQIDENEPIDVPIPDQAEAIGIPNSAYSLQIGSTLGSSPSQENDLELSGLLR